MASDSAGQPFEPVETEPVEINGNVIDTTAELLGRAKPRRPRAKAPAPVATRKAGAQRRDGRPA